MSVRVGRAAVLSVCVVLVVACGNGERSEAPRLPPPHGVRASLHPPGDPFVGRRLYVDPRSSARLAADARRATDPAGAAALDTIAEQPVATWIGAWTPTPTVAATVRALLTRVAAARAYPVLVVYHVPSLDCGSLGSAGAASGPAYRAWVDQVAAGIGSVPAAIVLEPDALAGMSCLGAARQRERLTLVDYAVRRLAAVRTRAVYVDAGHSEWQPVDVMAARLVRAGVGHARGFALNVSNYQTTASQIAYGTAISHHVGGKPFVIDTGRNGRGSNGEWCNASGRALGQRPTAVTGTDRVDALLWIKQPGSSDGPCNGGPTAGAFWVSYAIGLARRASW